MSSWPLAWQLPTSVYECVCEWVNLIIVVKHFKWSVDWKSPIEITFMSKKFLGLLTELNMLSIVFPLVLPVTSHKAYRHGMTSWIFIDQKWERGNSHNCLCLQLEVSCQHFNRPLFSNGAQRGKCFLGHKGITVRGHWAELGNV